MNRRAFFKKMGLAAAAVAVVPALPLLAKETEQGWSPGLQEQSKDRLNREYVNPEFRYLRPRPWLPNTRYNVGDVVRFSDGHVVVLTMAGTTCSMEMYHGTILPLKGDF